MLNTITSVLLALFSASAQSAADPDTAPISPASPSESVRVVELFTSQGCPMCPSANELLESLSAADPDLLALAYGVGYWDVYGWADTFARPEFTDRQQAYVDAGEPRRVYTPHFVVNGSPEKLRFRHERITSAVEGAEALPVMVNAVRTGDRIAVMLDGEMDGARAEIWAVAYHPGRETVTPDEGPNAGREVSHFNMVRAVEFAGYWEGGALSLALDAPGEEGLAAAILVQDGPGGRILTAAKVASSEP
jgi:hypothetical protein